MQGNCQRNNFSSSASNFDTQIYDTYSDHQDHQNSFKSFVGATNIEMNFKVHKWGKLRKFNISHYKLSSRVASLTLSNM